MAVLKRVLGQHRAAELIGSAYATGRLAHAYLFAGPSGVGRFTAAQELAASWMCREDEQGYCGSCRDCSRVFSFQHPDVMYTIPVMGSTTPEDVAGLFEARLGDGLTPLRFEGNTRITIDQVRELEERLSRKAFEDRGHIEIILDADRMGVEAANALLKTLEEPPDDTVMILISSRWSALLPTVRSRAHLIRFRRLEEELVERILRENLDVSAETAAELALASDGRPGLAIVRARLSVTEDPELTPSSVLSCIGECASVSCALSLASRISRKLGRDGALEFCREMQSYLHDLRRHRGGMRTIRHRLTDGELPGPDDEACMRGVGLFRRAEVRLSGYGMTGMVLGAAFTGMWEVLRDGGSTPA